MLVERVMDALNLRDRAASGASAVVALIEQCIADGTWGPGTKLPTERELEKRFNVSRNTLRKSLRVLEEQGKIVRHVGRGSFVTSEATVRATGEDQSLTSRIIGASPAEIMELRLMVEPQAAELAAGRATAADLHRMEECLAHAERAQDVPEFEHWDGMLHVAIIGAAKNGLLADVYDAINAIRNQPEWARLKVRSLTPARRAVYEEQHRRIVSALKDRDGDQARAALQEHLLQVRTNLLGS
ncbi:FadR family transcriptional regulator (plasmid) [Azospirillum baldaniorum]|uniref:Transcriptional regulator, GntR-family n=2 Tax=Azospirillum baldaniorum TaxID=1064539 RepID=A0A9P1JYM0_9PROT|nr:FadR family transcriptional regulator [Azospirillum baldaniorum]TWA61952.1 GntR family transcriptional regulator [Azospirillum baldaniorum]TWA76154.1 GntR family transcriptional regulator [Azospirillum brasilense]CCD02329.1 transcriptional regulator, GntR-family [Azospirillum baldaniorum]